MENKKMKMKWRWKAWKEPSMDGCPSPLFVSLSS